MEEEEEEEEALEAGLAASWRFLSDTWMTLRRMVKREVRPDNLGGIITIGRVSYDWASQGLAKLFPEIQSLELCPVGGCLNKGSAPLGLPRRQPLHGGGGGGGVALSPLKWGHREEPLVHLGKPVHTRVDRAVDDAMGRQHEKTGIGELSCHVFNARVLGIITMPFKN